MILHISFYFCVHLFIILSSRIKQLNMMSNVSNPLAEREEEEDNAT